MKGAPFRNVNNPILDRVAIFQKILRSKLSLLLNWVLSTLDDMPTEAQARDYC